MELAITSYCTIRPWKAKVNGQVEFHDQNFITFAEFIKTLFKRQEISYPKFYKMDPLSKLGFLTAEMALKPVNIDLYHKENIGVVLSNAAASLDTDITYQQSIANRDQYFPSPSVFVYTLPNIMIGEISIRHKLKGENAFFVSESFSPSTLTRYVEMLFDQKRVDACLTGWVELLNPAFSSFMCFVENGDSLSRQAENGIRIPFTDESCLNLFNEKID